MKIVFSDLDGTLLTTEKVIAPRTREMLDELARQGIEFVPCSGRPPVGLPKDLLAHPAVHYAIGSNGAVVYHIIHEGQETRSEIINRVDMQASSILWLYERVKDLDITFDVYADGKVFAERARFERMGTFGLNPKELKNFRAMRTPIDITIPELLPTLAHIERTNMYWHTLEQRAAITALVDERPEMMWTHSLPINLEVSNVEASKGAALTWLCTYLGINIAESLAFGDYPNDQTMIVAAGDGVAMANALDEIKAVANHVTTSNDEDGVAAYVEKCLSAH